MAKNSRPLPGGHWWMLALTGLLFGLVFFFVDLKPVVDSNFFFSSNDPQFKKSKTIEERFPSHPELILAVATNDISSAHYLSHIEKLTQRLRAIDAVSSVKSLSSGPKNLADALASPFWSRLLIAPDRKSSNVIVFLERDKSGATVRQIEGIAHELEERNFHIHIAGPPYVVEQIRRSLTHDFRSFSLIAVLLFGVTMAALFRSLRLFLGMMTTCVSAVLLTLLLQALVGVKIGILTVNLGTIVFVIALSHLVYMTFNWQMLPRQKKSSDLAAKARAVTFPASFWSMVCSSLGFGSLIIVQARPLRELGEGGVLGTVVAFACAYLMYPAFLRWTVPHSNALLDLAPPHRFWSRRFILPSLAIIILSGVLALGMAHIDTDPSLLDYFKPGTKLHEDLAYVDRSGGSNPLTLVVSSENGGRLDNDKSYHDLWNLQGALEKDRDVGTVISLPTLLAEGDRTPFSFLVSYSKMVSVLEEPKHARIARSFISPGRTEAVFLLRMSESHRSARRSEVVDHLRAVAHHLGFKVPLVGGIYYLQGRLANLVQSSLVTGLFWLNLLFVLIAFVVARSFRGAFAMIGSLLLVPLCLLGGIGWIHLPMDVISAPATNVCIGIAIDSMIHLVFAVRRAQSAGKKGWSAWVAGREEQWRGIVYSDVIIGAGFAIFLLSDFPPTQRFGLVVLAGTLTDIAVNLIVFPFLAGAKWKQTNKVAR